MAERNRTTSRGRATNNSKDTKKARNDKFVWKAGDVKMYNSVEEWRKATKNKKKK